jgi:uncharacterized protein YndB with AHSA1/START domain
VNRIIKQGARLRCDVHRAFEMFTVDELVQSWLAPLAETELHQGGKYQLFWDLENREHDSTIGCRVTAIEPDTLLCFEWKGPRQYRQFMNDADPLTHVVVFFVPCPDAVEACTEVRLVHSGWGSAGEWEEARQWFDRAWRVALEQLEHGVNTGSP